MSDSDEYVYNSSDDDIEYSSDEGDGGNEVDDAVVEIENTFYDADDYRTSNPAKAAEMYEKVVALESARGGEVKYRFKSLLHLVKLNFLLNNHAAMVEKYESLLTYIDSVTSNELQDAIQSVLDTVSASTEVGMLSRVYEVTLRALKEAHNDRLWFSTLCKKGRLLVLSQDWDALATLVADLHASCKLENGQDDPSKGNHLMEVYALDIQLATSQGDRERMKTIYQRVMELNAAVADPRVTGIVRQSFGRMRMNERKWEAAYDEFYAAFKSYQEAGSQEARKCLKYLVLASILSKSVIDPFDSQETQVYKDDKEVAAMAQLRAAYQVNDIKTFESILKDKRNHIADDHIIAPVVSDLLRGVRSRVITRIVRPYRAIRLEFLAKELDVGVDVVEPLLVELILDGLLDGRIDQINGIFHQGSQSRESRGMATKALEAVEDWTQRLAQLRLRIGATLPQHK